jgi:hypothetical protein
MIVHPKVRRNGPQISPFMLGVNGREEERRTYDKLDFLPLLTQASPHKLVHLPDLICRREFTLELSLVGEFDTYPCL